MLIGNVDSARRPVYGWVCALVLTEIRVTGCHDKVRRSRGTCASDASIAPIMAGRTGWAAKVAHSQFDHAAKAGAWSKLGVGHVQAAIHGVNRQELFVKKAAEGEVVEGLAIRANRGYDWLAAGQSSGPAGAHHLASGNGQSVLGDKEGNEDATDVEVGLSPHLVNLHTGIAVDNAGTAVGIGQTSQINE